MAHFARINENNIVQEVIVVDNNSAATELLGQEFIASIGISGTWLQTSYNTLAGRHLLSGTPFRKNYAGIGFTYDSTRDAFIAPKPYSSWVLTEDTCLWEAPVAYPTDGKDYLWDEATVSWVEA